MEVNFIKMHGIGNDFIIIDFYSKALPEGLNFGQVSKKFCDRHFGIGADGLMLILPSQEYDLGMKIFNSDGSEAQMCGNGIRCFAKYVYENDVLKERQMSVETLGGIKELTLHVESGNVRSIRVDMGTATFKTSEVPMASDEEEFIDQELLVDGEPLKLTAISVGNPHAIIFTESLEDVALDHLGPLIENHEAFPERTNVHFVGVVSPQEVEMLTWERGAGSPWPVVQEQPVQLLPATS